MASNPTFTRRALLKSGAAATAVLAAGCPANVQDWIQIAVADLPTILQIVTSILSMAGVAGGVQVKQFGAQAQTDLQTVQALITSYKTVNGNARPGVLGEIDSTLIAVRGNLTSLLTAFRVVDPVLQQTVAAAIGAAITMLMALQSFIPPPPTAGARRMTMAKSSRRDGNEVMKEAFNAIVGKSYPGAVIQ